jgi:hypothetical protein
VPKSLDSDFDPLDAFTSLKLRSQQLLQKHKNSDFLRQLDSELGNFARDGKHARVAGLTFLVHAQTTLQYCFPKAYQRQMIHSISEFYGLVSFSKDNVEGGRDTIVYKKEVTNGIPSSFCLSTFLV